MRVQGFEPVFDANSRVLILGSFPSVKSRADGFYYANPRNRFWVVLSTVFNEKVPSDVDGKIEFLLRRRVALWDVVQSCEIVGSLDSNIKNPVIANFDLIFKSAKIELVVCNGKKSFELFSRFISEDIETVYLPSTSPANAGFSIEPWLSVLR